MTNLIVISFVIGFPSVCALIYMFRKAPLDTEIWPVKQWFNCAHCPCSFTEDGRTTIYPDKHLLPLGVCPTCENRIKQSISRKLEASFKGGE